MPQYSFSSIASLATSQPRERPKSSEDGRQPRQLMGHPGLQQPQGYPATYQPYSPVHPTAQPQPLHGHPGGQQPLEQPSGHSGSGPSNVPPQGGQPVARFGHHPASGHQQPSHHNPSPPVPEKPRPFSSDSSGNSVHPQLGKGQGYPVNETKVAEDRPPNILKVSTSSKSTTKAVTMGANSLKITINTKNLQSTLSGGQGSHHSDSSSSGSSSKARPSSSSESSGHDGSSSKKLKHSLSSDGRGERVKEVKPEGIKDETDLSESMEQDYEVKYREVGTMTSCGSASRTMLDGLILTETKGGLLVVNVMYKNKEFVGTLMDCTSPSNSWASPRHSEIPPPDKKPKKKKKTKSSSDLRLAPRIGLRNRRRIKKRERRDKRMSWDRTNRNNKSNKRISF